MGSIKIKLRVSGRENKMHSLYFQIIHQRKVRQLNTGLKIYEHEWNVDEMKINFHLSNEQRIESLLQIRKVLKEKKEEIELLMYSLQQRGDYSIDDVINRLKSKNKEDDLFSFAGKLMDELKSNGGFRTAETYHSALNSFRRFCNNKATKMSTIDVHLIKQYEIELKKQGLTLNTTSFYMRNLRSIYNKAVERGLIDQQNPFRNVYTGVEKTIKRAVGFDVIKKIKSLRLSSKSLSFARDMFLLSFYTRGMSFVDIAYLKKNDLQYGILSYRRKKTGQKLYIKWEECMDIIINRYAANTTGSPFLLPIISGKDTNEKRVSYRNALLSVNRSLKKISQMLQLDIPLTTYVARHTWASIAKEKNIPLAVISEGMGHESETTTKIYLASLDRAIIDQANLSILNEL